MVFGGALEIFQIQMFSSQACKSTSGSLQNDFVTECSLVLLYTSKSVDGFCSSSLKDMAEHWKCLRCNEKADSKV